MWIWWRRVLFLIEERTGYDGILLRLAPLVQLLEYGLLFVLADFGRRIYLSHWDELLLWTGRVFILVFTVLVEGLNFWRSLQLHGLVEMLLWYASPACSSVYGCALKEHTGAIVFCFVTRPMSQSSTLRVIEGKLLAVGACLKETIAHVLLRCSAWSSRLVINEVYRVLVSNDSWWIHSLASHGLRLLSNHIESSTVPITCIWSAKTSQAIISHHVVLAGRVRSSPSRYNTFPVVQILVIAFLCTFHDLHLLFSVLLL